MGIIQSVFCTVTFCLERVLTWTCCALLLMTLLLTILLLMVYGISMGYHYAQKELALFAMSSRTTGHPFDFRHRMGPGDDQVLRGFSALRKQDNNGKKQTKERQLPFIQLPLDIFDTVSPPTETTLAEHERLIAHKIIGRYRRSKPNNFSSRPFFRALKNRTI